VVAKKRARTARAGEGRPRRALGRFFYSFGPKTRKGNFPRPTRRRLPPAAPGPGGRLALEAASSKKSPKSRLTPEVWIF